MTQLPGGPFPPFLEGINPLKSIFGSEFRHVLQSQFPSYFPPKTIPDFRSTLSNLSSVEDRYLPITLPPPLFWG